MYALVCTLPFMHEWQCCECAGAGAERIRLQLLLCCCQEFVNFMRQNADGSVYAAAMAPAVVRQVLVAFRVLSGEDGTGTGSSCLGLLLSESCVFARVRAGQGSLCTCWRCAGAQKLAAIRRNSNFFRTGLKAMGVEVLGDEDSPIVPIMLFHSTKIAAFSRECLARGVRTAYGYCCFTLAHVPVFICFVFMSVYSLFCSWQLLL